MFAKACPHKKPLLPEKGGWDGVFDKDLFLMLIGIGFNPEGDNSCMNYTYLEVSICLEQTKHDTIEEFKCRWNT